MLLPAALRIDSTHFAKSRAVYAMKKEFSRQLKSSVNSKIAGCRITVHPGRQHMAQALIGDFGHRMVVGSFKPDPATMLIDTEVHGLTAQTTYAYGFFHDDEGFVYCAQRKFIGSLTAGGFFMTQNGDPAAELDVHPDTGRSARGEVRRVINSSERKWSEPVYHRLPKGIISDREQPVSVHWTGDRLTWDEGDILDLTGESAGNGVQFMSLSRDQPMLYTSMCFWMDGIFQGKQVQGPIWFDIIFMRSGMDWKDYAYFNDIQIMETDFCNKYADGTYEWGRLINGFDGYNPGVVVRGDDVFSMTPDLVGRYDVDSANWPTGAEFDCAGARYEFVGPESGRMTQFSESRWANYRAQYGKVRRIGDKDEIVDSFAWVEGFGDRIVSGGLVR